MKEWVIVACRAEAKVFERKSSQDDLQWLKTLNNKRGRKKEREFNTDRPGVSYAKFFGSCAPHELEGKHKHADEVARHFSKQIAEFIEKAFAEKRFVKLTIFSGSHFLGILKGHLSKLCKKTQVDFVPKNIERADTESISQYLAQ